MNQEQIDVVGVQPTQRFIERPSGIVGSVIAVVQLAGDEHLSATEPGVADTLADLLLVAVHLGSVDVSIADLQGDSHRFGGQHRLDLKHSEAELRNVVAVVQLSYRYRAHVVCPSLVALLYSLTHARAESIRTFAR